MAPLAFETETMMQFETFLDVLLVEEIPVKDAQATGVKDIITSEAHAQKPFLARVITADKQFSRQGMMVDMPYKPGDLVMTNEFGRDYLPVDPFRNYAPIKKNDKKYYLVRYEDVQGRIRET